MTFGEQVSEPLAHHILDRSLARGVNFIDTAEMYAVPAKAETCGATETIIGNWLHKTPGARERVVLATKVAGPSRGMPWIRGESSGLTEAEIVERLRGQPAALEDRCDRSLSDPLAGAQRARVRFAQLRAQQRQTLRFGARAARSHGKSW